MSGYYLMHRGWLEHPVFAAEPFSRRDAWCWLIERAFFVPGEIGVKGKTITLQRGQLCHSLRYMATAWRWDEARVRRFLARLASEKMISCVADAGQNVITICKYDDYQIRERVADAAPDAAPTQERRSIDAIDKEDKELKELDHYDEDARGREIVKTFLEFREHGWPATSRLPANGLTMLADAKQFARSGVTTQLFAELVGPRMARMAEGNRSPPNSPGFFRDTITDALARIAESAKPLPIERSSNGSPPQADPGQPARNAAAGGDRFLKRFGKGLGELPGADADHVLPAASGER